MSHPLAQQFQGLILAERERNMRDDSYFMLTVWDADAGQPDCFEYAATAYGGIGPMHHDTVRAAIAETFPSVIDALRVWNTRSDRIHAFGMIERRLDYSVFKGDTVRVARGRKVPKGLVGKVVSIERDVVVHRSRYGTWDTKADFAVIAVDGGVWKIDAKNLDVVARGEIMQELFDLAE